MASNSNSNRPTSCVCIVLVVGLPGSGKTKLSEFLKQQFTSPDRSDAEELSLNVILIRYDEMIPDVHLRTIVDFESGKYSTARHEVMTTTERLVYMLKDIPTDEPVHKIVLKSGSDNQFVKKAHEWELIPLRRTLIIIDDNVMCVSSMRYSYFELARRHNVGFCQFYLDCTEEDAMQHNKNRPPEEVIPDNVFQKIAKSLEPPENKPWEKNSLLIPAYEPFTNESTVLAVKALISKAFLNPEESIGDWNDIDEATRDACMVTILLQSEIALRTFVTQKLKLLKEKGMDADELRIKSRIFERSKCDVLEGIKTREIVVPNEIFLMFQFDHPLANFRLRNFIEGKLFPS